jgi:deoxyribose-phosphate aldolase
MSTFTQPAGSPLSGRELARYIDHTLLKPEATEAQFIQLCEEARRYHFKTVCVNPARVKRCASLLNGSDTDVATVAGFPLGEVKAYEAQLLVEAGAEFVKTSTGFSIGGATTHDVALMREVVGPDMGVKAAGGIKTYADMIAMITAGANRISASASVRIMQEAEQVTLA